VEVGVYIGEVSALGIGFTRFDTVDKWMCGWMASEIGSVKR
jgi:hypothetical protein